MYEPVSDGPRAQACRNEPHTVSKGIHWRIPAIMISSFLAGALFILGHHLFYQSLHHQATSNAVFEQQINTGIGTAFAFIVKMFLVLSVGTSFWQVFWLQMKIRPIRVESVDVLMGLLEDALGFFRFKIIGHFPILLGLATMTWLLPLAAIVPPAALTIQLSPMLVDTTRQEAMPVLNYSSGEYAQMVTRGSNGGATKFFGGPTYNLNRISSATAFSGRILSFPSPASNASYILTFPAPALQCRELEGALRDDFTRNISAQLGCDITKEWLTDNDRDMGLRACFIQPMYMAWAPNSTHAVSFEGVNADNGSIAWSAETIGPDDGGGQVAQFYVASQPTINGVGPWSFVGCELHNATYELNVTITNGAQHINVTKLDYADGVPYLSAFNIIRSGLGNATDPFTGEMAWQLTDLTQFAYQSLMDMFGKLLSGQITILSRNAIASFDFATAATSVMQTALVNTVELKPIFDIAQTCSTGAVDCGGTEQTNEVLNISTPEGGPGLPQALEQLFQNMTLSLFSDSAFLSRNDSSPRVDVILRSPQNRYVYTAWRLLVPYLVGLGTSAIGVAIGFAALWRNGVSYTQSFSTVLRASRHARMDVQMQTKDLRGYDPTPEYIEKARIDFRIVDGVEGGEEVELKQRSRPDTEDRNLAKARTL